MSSIFNFVVYRKNGEHLIASVDLQDRHYIFNKRWSASVVRSKNTQKIYLKSLVNGKLQYLHRIITKAEPNYVVDHSDGNPLNNTRANLRVCNQSQNLSNKITVNALRYRGVKKVGEKFQARICFKHKQIHLGTYKKLKDAALAYNEAAKKLMGEFARLNNV